MIRRLPCWLLLFGLGWPPAGAAATCAGDGEPVRVERIAFEGNEVTQRITFLRELEFGEGDLVCPRDIELARQAILDLRLFRSVTSDVATLPSGSIVVTYTVRERWYLLPIPRVDASSDADFGYGVSLFWNNIGGLNHRLSVSGVRRELEERTLDNETIIDARYDWRRFLGSRNNLSLTARNSNEAAVAGERRYEDLSTSLGIGLSRQLTRRQTGQGWSLSTSLYWQHGRNEGVEAPPDEGVLTLASVGLGYRDVHSSVYSERGISASVAVSAQVPGVSDYNQSALSGRIARYLPVGERAHQSVHLHAQGATYHGGPQGRRSDAYELGGAGNLRGYEDEFAEGDTYWYAAAEYLRPLYWDWLRGLVVLEAGQVHRANFPEREKDLMLSLGVGLRMRLTWFVDAEVEIGVAYPLLDGDGARGFFGGSS